MDGLDFLEGCQKFVVGEQRRRHWLRAPRSMPRPPLAVQPRRGCVYSPRFPRPCPFFPCRSRLESMGGAEGTRPGRAAVLLKILEHAANGGSLQPAANKGVHQSVQVRCLVSIDAGWLD